MSPHPTRCPWGECWCTCRPRFHRRQARHQSTPLLRKMSFLRSKGCLPSRFRRSLRRRMNSPRSSHPRRIERHMRHSSLGHSRCWCKCRHTMSDHQHMRRCLLCMSRQGRTPDRTRHSFLGRSGCPRNSRRTEKGCLHSCQYRHLESKPGRQNKHCRKSRSWLRRSQAPHKRRHRM